MFSKDPKYSKIQIFRTSAQNPAGGAYSGPPRAPSWWSGDEVPLPENSTPALGPSGLTFRV